MPHGRDVVYLYDGTFDGLLCCVFESYMRRESPLDILPDDSPQLPLCEVHEVVTTRQGAHRVFLSLEAKLGTQAAELVQAAFFHGDDCKALAIYRFIRLGYRMGPKIYDMRGDGIVSAVHKLAQAAWHESHMMTGFVRFSESQGVLTAVIEPKHFILPLMRPHFCERYNGERFLIYDKAHGMVLVYQPYEARILAAESVCLPDADETELAYRRLWTQYYKTIAIESRRNPRCQMGHMPKHFWSHLTEMQPEYQKRGGSVKHATEEIKPLTPPPRSIAAKPER